MRCFLIVSFLIIFYNPSAAQTAEEKPFQTHITTVDLSELKGRIFEAKKTYKIVYFFDQYCSATADIFPRLDALYKKSSEQNFSLFVLSLKTEKRREELRDHLFYHGYEEPFYIFKKKSFLNFYNKVVRNICETCEPKMMGYSDFMVYDKNNELIEYTNNNQSKEERIAILKKYMK